MIKIKNLQYRSLWYKKNFYYLKSGQSLSASTKVASACQETMQIHQDIDNGLRLSDILRDPDLAAYFSKTEISFIRVAEQTGNIDRMFLSLSHLLKDQHDQRQKLASAFMYPVLVLCMTFCLLLLILLIIIPKIAPLFQDMKTLPIMTRIVMFLSYHLIHFWHVDLVALIFISSCCLYLKKYAFFMQTQGQVKKCILSKTIYVKEIYFYWHLEKWLKVVHMSVESGIPISDALLYGCESIGDQSIRLQFAKIQQSVYGGKSCAQSLKLLNKDTYEKIKDWESVIDSGERTGTFAEVFGVCHLSIKESLATAFDRFQRMIEPALIVFVGAIVLAICISIILPMYQLTQSLQ